MIKEKQILADARKIINDAIDTNLGKDGYVWRSKAWAAVKGAEQILDLVSDYIKKHELILAMKLCILVLEEMMKAEIDDSNAGEKGRVIFDAIDKLGIITSFLKEDDHATSFDLILAHAANKHYSGWPNWREEIYETLKPLCTTPERQRALDEKMTSNKKKYGEVFNFMIKETQTVEEYIAQVNPEHHEIIAKTRELIKECVPGVAEQISYRMPTYKLNGKVVVHFHAGKEHLGLYPEADGVAEFLPKLGDYKTTKGAIQFPYKKGIPYDLIREIVQFKKERAE
ncbi:MAG: DUF1801 domain-containing protein [Firmicutes bacterium]|nr:DUF1801 domain-containing protein [Bacillota bacterium]